MISPLVNILTSILLVALAVINMLKRNRLRAQRRALRDDAQCLLAMLGHFSRSSASAFEPLLAEMVERLEREMKKGGTLGHD